MRNFLDRVEKFLERHPEVSPTRLGLDAVGDGAFVTGIRAGRNPRIDTAQKVLDWMKSYRQPAARKR